MSTHNHTGVIPEWLNKEYLEKMLENHFGERSLHLHDFAITPGSNVGDNYCCQIFRIELNYTRNGQKETRYIVGKVLTKSEFTDEISKNFDLVGMEVKAFKHTLPLLYEVLKKSIGNADRFFPDPICIDGPNKTIFMEDLKQDGYQLADRKKSLDLAHSLLVIKALAYMHASSYLLLKNDPSHKNMYENYFWTAVNEAFENIIEGAHRCLLKALPGWNLSDEIKEKVRNVNGIEKCQKTYKKREDSFNAILHGDCWLSNMMFKQNNGKVESVKLLDFQIINYNSIGLDLNYFIFSSPMLYVKLNHIDDLLSEYYNTFINVTGEIKGFSLETVRKEFNERLGFGLMVQLHLRPAIIAPGAFDPNAHAKKEESTINDQVYLHEPYIEETIKILPLFLEHGIL